MSFLSIDGDIMNTSKFAHSVLITGCSRGIGLELVDQLAPRVDLLFATCISPVHAIELKALASLTDNVTILEMDVTKEESIDHAVEEISELVEDQGLSCLINNASVNLHIHSTDVLTAASMKYECEVNAIGATIVVKKFLPLLKKAAVRNDDSEVESVSDKSLHRTAETKGDDALHCADLDQDSSGMGCPYLLNHDYDNGDSQSTINIPSQKSRDWKACILNIAGRNASIEEQADRSQISYSHDSAKVALNMLTQTLSVDLTDQGILVASLQPCRDGSVGVGECVGGMIDVACTLEMKHSGLCFSWDGLIVPR